MRVLSSQVPTIDYVMISYVLIMVKSLSSTQEPSSLYLKYRYPFIIREWFVKPDLYQKCVLR